MAQAPAIEGESRTVVIGMVQRVASTLVSGVVMVSEDSDDIVEDIVEDPEAPAPDPEDPESEPGGETVELPELNLTDLAEYTSQGVTFLAPADWIVDTDMGEGTPFEIEVPGTDLLFAMELDAGLEFPSWLALALFRSQAELLIPEIGEGAQLDELTTLYTQQNLPVVKMAFSGVEDDPLSSGAMYLGAPNENAYIVIAAGSLDNWLYAAPGVDLLIESLTFEEDEITVSLAEEGPLVFTNEDETLEVTIPQGWYVMDTGDPQFPIIAGEPEVRYVAAIGTESVFGEEVDPQILEDFLPEVGELDAESEQELFETILDLVANSGSPITFDEELSALVTREGAITVRLVGDAEFQEELSMPVVVYVDLRTTGVGVISLFGDIETALGLEEEITAMLESITGL
jgi:hypothetical protein